MRRSVPRVWCMEGRWSSSVRDVRTVTPMLAALQDSHIAEHVREHINSSEDLARSIRRWGQRQHEAYNIGYLALHGSPGKVYVGREAVSIDDLGCWADGRLSGKVLHFGSCSVLRTGQDEQAQMRKTIGVRAITGYTTDVDWFQSFALDLLLFDALAYYKRIDAAEKYMRRTYPDLVKLTGLIFVR